MRQLRLALALLLALALPATGLLSHAARAQGLSASVGLCMSDQGKGGPLHLAVCSDHCLGTPSGNGVAPATMTVRPTPTATAVCDTPRAPAARVSTRLTHDHAPRAPPAVA